MIRPKFTFDAEANGWLSEPFTIHEQATVHIELSAIAPVVTLKQEDDGEYANYGQTFIIKFVSYNSISFYSF